MLMRDSTTYETPRRKGLFRKLSLCALVIALAFATLCMLVGCSSKWDNLSFENGRFAYVVDGKAQYLTGIDVSDHNHYVDWRAVAADDIDFAIVRAGRRGYTEGGL